MVKRSLGAPKVPRGPQYDFFDLLQGIVRRHGDLSLSDLVAQGVRCSRQVLHRVLVGPDLPSRPLVAMLLDVLNCSDEEKKAVEGALLRAQEDRIRRRRRDQTMAGDKSNPAQPLRRTQLLRIKDFQRELHQLRAAAGSPSFRDIAARSGQYGLLLPRSTLGDWFQGQHIPSNFDALLVLVHTLEAMRSAQDGSETRVDLEKWRSLWAAARPESVPVGRDVSGSGLRP